ncbi:iron-containing alcohol dehydrogenase family protein [Halorientalis litorea]|jgi:alcohol dehydrogenase class IV|uniref:iron-containing alcohol dehydrogenase family protein n=1 Tax=Halorientalis litorea TaxID=2931977 RepID=UPI001FF5267B|nr:iron-containing alcohol dehydrogenase family protein [Halorientalis litorea]
MPVETVPFVHDYQPGAIHYGRGCVADLGATLADRGLDSALVVCGRNVGANDDLMDPILAGLGDRLAGVFAETTPDKRVETALAAAARMREVGADALVPVGAGSSMDVAKAAGILHAEPRDIDAVQAEVEETGSLAVPDGDLIPPAFAVPTTFAGADLSVMGSTTVPTDEGRVAAGMSDAALMPTGLFYDPNAFDTTPMDVLAGSAFNGFDKALEAVYSRNATPVTDATALRSLRYLRSSLPRLRDADDPAVMERAVTGILLAQYGLSVPDSVKFNVIHAFGHAFRTEFGVQQGVAHAVLAPHVLAAVFDRVDGRRELLAEALVDGDPADPAAVVVDTVREIRAGLDLPTRLDDVVDPTDATLRSAAEYTLDDHLFPLGPEGFDPSVTEVEAIIRDALTGE